MEENKAGITEIAVRLLANGRYLWTITSQFPTEKSHEGIEEIKQMDRRLRDQFPDHVTKGSTRTAYVSED